MPSMLGEQPGSVPLASRMPFNPKFVAFQQTRSFKTGRYIAYAIMVDLLSKQVKDDLTDTTFPRDQKQKQKTHKKNKYTVFKILQRLVGYRLTVF